MVVVYFLHMLLVSKGFTRLQIEVNEKANVRVDNVPHLLLPSILVMANSLQTILQYKLKDNKDVDKKTIITNYFKKMGWQVEQ